jgi:hypothetical protein
MAVKRKASRKQPATSEKAAGELNATRRMSAIAALASGQRVMLMAAGDDPTDAAKMTQKALDTTRKMLATLDNMEEDPEVIEEKSRASLLEFQLTLLCEHLTAAGASPLELPADVISTLRDLGSRLDNAIAKASTANAAIQDVTAVLDGANKIKTTIEGVIHG